MKASSSSYQLLPPDEIHKEWKLIRENYESALMREYTSDEYLRPKQNINFLSDYRDLQLELARLLVGWIPNIPWLKLKMDLGRQAYLMIQIIEIFELRLRELPGSKKQIGANERFKSLQKILAKALNIEDFLIGVFKVVQINFFQRLEDHLKECDPIADLPTIDRIETVLSILKKQIEWVDIWVSSYTVQNPEGASLRKDYIQNVFESLGGFHSNQVKQLPLSPYQDNKLQDAGIEPAQLEQGFSIVEEFKFIAPRITHGKLSDLLYQNFAEMFVPDSLGYMVFDMDGMPYEFYRDFIKQLWDECRHIAMGMRELEKLGIPLNTLPLNEVKREKPYTWYLARLCYTGEGCSFPRKLSAADAFFRLGFPSAATITEYDIADESHHVKYIERWLPLLHQKEECKESLAEIIEEVQRQSLSWVKNKSKLDVKNVKGKFGAFCKAIDFDIDFTAV